MKLFLYLSHAPWDIAFEYSPSNNRTCSRSLHSPTSQENRRSFLTSWIDHDYRWRVNRSVRPIYLAWSEFAWLLKSSKFSSFIGLHSCCRHLIFNGLFIHRLLSLSKIRTFNLSIQKNERWWRWVDRSRIILCPFAMIAHRRWSGHFDPWPNSSISWSDPLQNPSYRSSQHRSCILLSF